MARKDAIQSAAKSWATVHNQMMTDWGFGPDSFIDHRSYAERGIDQVPTIHEGPGARKLAASVMGAATKPEWQHVDSGHTRAEANKLIREINKAKERLNEQPANRLGGNNDTNVDRSKGRVPWFRKGSVGNRGNGGATTRQRNPTTKDPRLNCSPFALAERRQSGSEGRSNGVDSNRRADLAKAKISRHAAISRGVRWVRARPLRRTYLNLRLFNDTLQARLLLDDAPKQFLESAEDLTREPSQVRAPKQDTR